MWHESRYCSFYKSSTSREESEREKSKGTFFIPDRCFTVECLYDFFEVSFSSVKETFDHSFWQTKMTGISKISYAISIFDVYDTGKPIFFTFRISIHSSFHPDKIICLRLFSPCVYGSIFGSSTYLFEGCRHIRNS